MQRHILQRHKYIPFHPRFRIPVRFTSSNGILLSSRKNSLIHKLLLNNHPVKYELKHMTKTDYTYEIQKQKRCTSKQIYVENKGPRTSDFEITHC